jgi:signal peptidase I
MRVGSAFALRRNYLLVTVSGISMQPGLRPGDRLLVRRVRPELIKVGQIAVLCQPPADRRGPRPHADSPDGLLIKRVAAVPGDLVPAVCHASLSLPERVPPDNFIVLGDNPDRSYDSRLAGLIPADLLFGVAVRQLSGRRR